MSLFRCLVIVVDCGCVLLLVGWVFGFMIFITFFFFVAVLCRLLNSIVSLCLLVVAGRSLFAIYVVVW